MQSDVRDVVVIVEGDETARGEVISLLGYRQSTFVAGWTALMYRLSSNRDALTLLGADGVNALVDNVVDAKWWRFMAGIGILMDAIPAQLNSPTVVFLPSGVVVNALTADFGRSTDYLMRSYALSNDQITAALRSDTGTGGPVSRLAVRTT